MPIVTKDGFSKDVWARSDAPASGAIAPLERVLTLSTPVQGGGVDLPNDADLNGLAPYLDHLALIAIDFPSFADGRGFSLAQRLRRRGFRGRLRARGHVIVDQFAYAFACGFDEVEIDEALAARQPEAMWIANAARPSWYQRSLGGRGGSAVGSVARGA